LYFLTYKIHSAYPVGIFTFCLLAKFHLPDSIVSVPTAIIKPLLKDIALNTFHYAKQSTV
jgi:hypothetical protein